MPIVVDDVWEDRFDDRLVALPNGTWVSATDRTLTTWTSGPGRALVRSHPWSGPLAWNTISHEVSWGPTLATDGDPDPAAFVAALLPDVEAGDSSRHLLHTGALDPTGTTAFVAVHVSLGPDQAPRSRLALVDRASDDHVEVLADDLPDPTAVAWDRGPLLVGIAGAVLVLRRGVELVECSFDTAAAARALAVSPDGSVIAAGMAEGSVVTWEVDGTPGTGRQIHDGPILSLAWAPDGRALATGGADGRIQVLGGASTPELDLGAPVVALAWLTDGRLIAKAGVAAGRICALRLS